MSEKPSVLIISGVDPANGAGIGRDILTVIKNGGHPLSVPSVLTVQNSLIFLYSVPLSFDYISDAISCLIKEFEIKSIKTGLLPLNEKWINDLNIEISKLNVPVIIDPVLKATVQKSDDFVISESYIRFISGKNKILTPNLNELGKIHMQIAGYFDNAENMASNIVEKLKCSIVTTFEAKEPYVLVTTLNGVEKIPVKLYKSFRKIHGTGCAFSSALATELAKNNTLKNSVEKAADFVFNSTLNSVKYKKKGQYYLS